MIQLDHKLPISSVLLSKVPYHECMVEGGRHQLSATWVEV